MRTSLVLLLEVCLAMVSLHGHRFGVSSISLKEACGTEAAQVLEKSSSACSDAVKGMTVCSDECKVLQSGILMSSNPTVCQKAAMETFKSFGEKEQRAYIKKCTPKWPTDAVGIAVPGCVFAFPYYIGAMDSLINIGIIDINTTKMGVLSGGAVVAFGLCSGLSPADLQEQLTKFYEDSEKKFNSSLQLNPGHGTMTNYLMQMAKIAFPDNNTRWKECSSHINIWTTALDPADPSMERSQPYSVGTVNSPQELHRALATTSFISCATGCSPYVTFRNKPMIDGSHSANFKQLCPHGVKRCVTMETHYVGEYVKIGGGECDTKAKDLKEPKKNPSLFCSLPKPNGLETVPIGNLPTKCPVSPPSVNLSPRMADIHPGKYKENPLPITCSKWQGMDLFPDPAYFEDMFVWGQKDAIAWAQEQKLTI